MSKIVLLTSGLLGSGVEALAKAISEKSAEAAADILIIVTEKNELQANLEKALAELKTAEVKLALTEQDRDEALKQNEALVAEIEDLSKNPAPVVAVKGESFKALSFKHEDEEYGFVLPSVFHKNQRITALDVSLDEKLQKELIKMQSGMIYKK